MKRFVMSNVKTVKISGLTWTIASLEGDQCFLTSLPTGAVHGSKAHIAVNGYSIYPGTTGIANLTFTNTRGGGTAFWLRNDAYSTVEAFVQAEGDKTIIYETTTPRRCLPVTYKAQQLITGQQQHFNITPTVDSQLSNLASNAIKNHVYIVIYDYLNMPQQTTPFSAFQVYDEINGIVYVYEQDIHIRGNGRWSALFTATKDSNRLLCRFRGNAGVAYDCYLERMLVDLTEIYGAGNEPSDVSTFLSQHPEYNSYVPFYYGKITQRRIIETKAKSVDLGTLTWTKQTASQMGYDYFLETEPLDEILLGKALLHCDSYEYWHGNRTNIPRDKMVSMSNNTNANNIAIRDSSFTDVASFKQAMQGVILTYQTT